MKLINQVLFLSLYFTCSAATARNTTQAPAAFFSCIDYHCRHGSQVQLGGAQWRAVAALFTPGRSPAEERRQIRQAIAVLEQQVGALTGTWRDLAGNVAGAGEPGQLDCISESKNTTTYLRLLQQAGLLKWHAVEERQVRHSLIFNVHLTAVIRDLRSGQRYAVDSWFLDNGQPPYIQAFEAWKSGRAFDRGQKDLGHQ